MRETVARQKARTAREVDRMVKANERAALRALRRRVQELTAEARRHKTEAVLQRRSMLTKMRAVLRRLPRREQARRKEGLAALSKARADFRAWWMTVQTERRRRLDELAIMQQRLRTMRTTSKRRIADIARKVRDATETRLARLAASAEERRAELERAIRDAQRDLATERNDQAQFRRTKRTAKRSRRLVKPSERTREWLEAVEVNLTTPEEYAVWHRERKAVLDEAKSKGITEPHAVAELVRERVELEPEIALDFMQQAADRWLEQELQRQGWAA